MNKYRTLFFGTPDFALPSLRALISAPDFDVVGVVTQPDKPVGRKQILTPPPVKAEALKHGLSVFQPEKIKNYNLEIRNLDLIIVVAYAKIIPPSILNQPKYGCINVHGSLLPRYRGAACIQAAIRNGDPTTGVTIMLMDEGLDTGPILSQREINISAADTTGTLFDKVAQTGAAALLPALRDYIAGRIKPQAQTGESSYVGLIKKQDGRIDFTRPAREIERHIRAMTPWPGAFAYTADQKMIKILKVNAQPVRTTSHQAGELFDQDGRLLLQGSPDALEVLELQLEGKNKLKAEEFLHGNQTPIILK